MFKKLMIPMIAAIAAVALAFGTQRSYSSSEEKSGLATYYFQYTANAFDEASYLDPNNWSQRNSSPGDDCPGVDVPCVIKANTASSAVVDLMTHFSTLGTGNVKSFVENPDNIIHYKEDLSR